MIFGTGIVISGVGIILISCCVRIIATRITSVAIIIIIIGAVG